MLSAHGSGHAGGDAACSSISEIAERLWPSDDPSVLIHTKTFETGAELSTGIRLCPGCIGVGGVSSVASDNAVGALLTAPRNGFPEGAAAA